MVPNQTHVFITTPRVKLLHSDGRWILCQSQQSMLIVSFVATGHIFRAIVTIFTHIDDKELI